MFKKRYFSSDLPEELLRDRLAHHLRNNPLKTYTSVSTELSIGYLNGKVDILADYEVWEIKKDQCSGLDVYQLFAYMDMGGFSKGYFIASSFTTGAKEAIKFINEKHDVDIQYFELEYFPINHLPTNLEREKYY